jgi:hypothetical protein
MQPAQQIANNKAIRSLMDDSLMIGRHRPIVASWFQNWVEEHAAVKKLEGEALTPANIAEAKKEIAEYIALSLMDEIQFTETKTCIHPEWRPGRPPIAGAPTGLEIRGSYYGFRAVAKSDAPKTVSPTDGSAVLGRAPKTA